MFGFQAQNQVTKIIDHYRSITDAEAKANFFPQCKTFASKEYTKFDGVDLKNLDVHNLILYPKEGTAWEGTTIEISGDVQISFKLYQGKKLISTENVKNEKFGFLIRDKFGGCEDFEVVRTDPDIPNPKIFSQTEYPNPHLLSPQDSAKQLDFKTPFPSANTNSEVIIAARASTISLGSWVDAYTGIEMQITSSCTARGVSEIDAPPTSDPIEIFTSNFLFSVQKNLNSKPNRKPEKSREQSCA
jgi:hypothetical protein